MGASIDDILNKPFSTRSYEEQVKIILDGRPQPAMERKLDICYLYNSVDWLAGCNKRKRLFCWPCVLFAGGISMSWCSEGYGRRGINVTNSFTKHEKSETHIRAVLDFRMFSKKIKAPVETNESEADTAKINDFEERNGSSLERIIGALCYMISKEQSSFDKMDNCGESLIETCRDVLNLLHNQQVSLNREDNTIALLKKSPSVFADLVHAMAEVVKKAIQEEIRSTFCVSVILSETSFTSTQSHIATVLRYVKNSEVCERFLGFTNAVGHKSQDGILRHISDVVEKYGFSEKLVCQSYDESITSDQDFGNLVTLVRERYPSALFIPCYTYSFTNALRRSLSEIRQCEIFFKTLSGIDTYFFENTRRQKAFEKFLIESTRNYHFSQSVAYVNEHREHFVQLFKAVIAEPGWWETDDIVKAQGYMQFLQEFETVFLLELFTRLFKLMQTTELNAVLKSNTPEVASSLQEEKLRLNILDFKENGFDELWSTVYNTLLYSTEVQVAVEAEENKIKINRLGNVKLKTFKTLRQEHRTLFDKILDCTLKLRTACSSDEIDFFHLMDPKFFSRNSEAFPDVQFQKLLSAYGSFFNSHRLKNELNVLFSHPAFTDKTVGQVLDFLVKEKLDYDFIEISKLARLLLSLPCNKTGDDFASSTTESYRQWFFVPGDRDLLNNDWIFLCVEK